MRVIEDMCKVHWPRDRLLIQVRGGMCKVHWPHDRLLIQVRKVLTNYTPSPSSRCEIRDDSTCKDLSDRPPSPHSPLVVPARWLPSHTLAHPPHHPPAPTTQPFLHPSTMSTQACDDSTRKDLSDLIDATAERMRAEGHPVSREAWLHGRMYARRGAHEVDALGAWVHGGSGAHGCMGAWGTRGTSWGLKCTPTRCTTLQRPAWT